MKRLFDRQLAIKFVLSGKRKDKTTLQLKHRFLDFDRVYKVVKGKSIKFKLWKCLAPFLN